MASRPASATGAAAATDPPQRAGSSLGRLPRALHPVAWWIWALGMATAASRTTNLLLLGLLLGVVALVVAARRGAAPWARGFKYYIYLALFVVGLRVVFRVLLDAGTGTTVMLTLPEIPLPDAAAGIRIGGPVTVEAVLAAVREGMRLATLLLCVGAANALANPKRLLASVPPALHEVGVAITVALSVAPQLVESAQRVSRARRLRGDAGRRTHLLRDLIVPVATDALDRSLMLAAAMDSRGHGRVDRAVRGGRSAGPLTPVLMIAGLIGLCIGTYAWLDSTLSRPLAVSMLVSGVLLSALGVTLAGRRVSHTRYRPDPWRAEEWVVSACGVLVAAGFVAAGALDPIGLDPSPTVIAWPTLPAIAVASLVAGALPALAAPPMTVSGEVRALGAVP